jgi:hypothetical protein
VAETTARRRGCRAERVTVDPDGSWTTVQAASDPTSGTLPPISSSESGFGQLASVEESFREAVRASGGVFDREFVIAGSCIRLRAATPDLLLRLSKAFSHLEDASNFEPDLTIYLWDSASHDTAAPPLPDVRDEQRPGAFFHYSNGPITVGFQRGSSDDPQALALPNTQTPALNVLDAARHEAWYWAADADRIPYWDQAAPLRYLFDWWFRDHGVHQLHAGAVGTREGGVLLVGKGGSGKSTSSLSVLQSELVYAGDDYVGVSLEPQPRVHSLYGSGKLVPDHARLLPFLVPALEDAEVPEGEKAVVYVHDHWPERTTAGFPLRAILAPRIVSGLVEAKVSDLPAVAVLAALAPSTVLQMHTRGQDSLARIRRLVQAVPSYQLQLGSDIESIPRAISDLLAELSQGG